MYNKYLNKMSIIFKKNDLPFLTVSVAARRKASPMMGHFNCGIAILNSARDM